MSLLMVENLSKAFGGVVAARDVSLAVESGEMVALIGPNGAGKSTIFNMVGGQLRPDRGAVLLDGNPITHASPQERFRRGIGRTFQIAQAFHSMNVCENVQMALISHHNESLALWRPARARHRDRALALLDQVGMAEAADRPCSELAYGDVKRVELAIALAGEPRLLLMDEPTAGMALRERAALMELTGEIARTRRIGVLFTEHDMDVVFGHASRVLVLLRGHIIAAGSPREIRANAQVRQAYLGDAPMKVAP
jgi:branched-chain amino acid transport system ATP-binding protein